MKLGIVIAVSTTLIACTTATHYTRQPWASVSVNQASAECLDAVQTTPTRSYSRCMKSKGWNPVY